MLSRLLGFVEALKKLLKILLIAPEAFIKILLIKTRAVQERYSYKNVKSPHQ